MQASSELPHQLSAYGRLDAELSQPYQLGWYGRLHTDLA